MKSAESKTATAAQPAHAQEHAQQPFFQKDGQGAFFSEETKQKGAFFNPPAVQPKLTIGKPGDKYEQEADAMAEKVVRQISASPDAPAGNETGAAAKTGGSAVQAQPAAPSGQEQLQRQEGEEEIKEMAPDVQRKAIFESNEDPPEADVQTKSAGAPFLQAKCDACAQEEKLQKQEEEEMSGPEQEPLVQRMCAECAAEEEDSTSAAGAKEEPEVQTQADSPAPTASPDLQSRLNNTKGGGQPLPENTRSSMESGFGADFSGVRVHTDGEAAQMNKELGAHAFTHGSDIYFNEGKYDTGSSEGKKLLAHELTHTVQQGGADKGVQRKPDDYAHPEDGEQSKGGINEEIKDELGDDKDINHPVITAEEKSQEKPPEDEKGEGVDKSELQEKSKPDVDRKQETQPVINEEIQGFKEEIKEEPVQTEPEEKEIKIKDKKGSKKERAAAIAVESFQESERAPIKIETQKVIIPEIKTPKDAKGNELPKNLAAQKMIPLLAGKIQQLRERGSALKENADIERLEAERMRGQIYLMYYGVYTSNEFIEKAREHTTARQEGLEQMKEHLSISEERTKQVLENTPGILEKSNEGKAESEPMVQSAEEQKNENENTKGQDSDAREEAEKRGKDLDNSGEKAEGIDEAITETKSKSEQMLEEAAVAQQQNEEVRGEIAINEEKLNQTQEKLNLSETQNTIAKAQLEAQERMPDEHIQKANELDREADNVIQKSLTWENSLHQSQEDYLNNMSTVPGTDESTGENTTIQAKAEPENTTIIQLMPGETSEQVQAMQIQKQQEENNNAYLLTLNEMDAELDAEFENMNFLEKGWYGLKFMGLSIMAKLSEVNWAEFTEELIQALVNPVKLVEVMGEMFTIALTPKHRPGEDPLTYILREAAGLATAIAIVFATISGLCLIGMGALAIINFWFPPSLIWSPPIYAELGALLTWSGAMLWATTKIALVLHALVFISDLIATAFSETANTLRQNSKQLVTDVEAAAFPIITAATVGIVKFLGYIGRQLGIKGGATGEVKTGPEGEVKTTPEEGVKTTPEGEVKTTPEEGVKTGPESEVKTTPEEAVKKGPEGEVKTTPELSGPIGADGLPQKMPSKIYRGGRSNESAATDLKLREGEEAVSFRESLSNPIGQNPVFRPGKPYIEVDVSKLPEGSVILDGGLNGMPPGHISVIAPTDVIVNAINKSGSGKFPK